METILTVKEESMIAVADAVREKSGSTESLSFPNGMVAAINSIETGGSNIAIDNKTIVEEDGVIRTVVGGYYADPVPAEMLYENNNNITLTYAHHENLNCSFDGYFPLPNWSPLGEEYLGKTFRLTWYETPYPDSPDYVIECFADAWLLDENLQTILVENRENTELVSGSIDNNTGYLSCMPHIYENPEDWEESYVSNFRIEVPGSDGGAVPIGSEFIPEEIWNEISNAYIEGNNAYNRAEEAHWRIDVLEQNGGSGGGASDAASVSFDDTAAQIGATTVQEAIEYLADEAVSSTSVQLQIDENDISLAQDLQRYEPTKIYWFRGAVNASDYSWSSKICPELTYNQGVIHWDLDETNIYGVYANEYLAFQKQSGLEYIMKKGHYYQFRALQLSDFKAFCNKYGRDGGNTEYYFGVQDNLPVIYSPVSTNIFALYYNVSKCYVMTDVTYVYADAASGVSEDRVSEMITEALGVIENGTY